MFVSASIYPRYLEYWYPLDIIIVLKVAFRKYPWDKAPTRHVSVSKDPGTGWKRLIRTRTEHRTQKRRRSTWWAAVFQCWSQPSVHFHFLVNKTNPCLDIKQRRGQALTASWSPRWMVENSIRAALRACCCVNCLGCRRIEAEKINNSWRALKRKEKREKRLHACQSIILRASLVGECACYFKNAISVTAGPLSSLQAHCAPLSAWHGKDRLPLFSCKSSPTRTHDWVLLFHNSSTLVSVAVWHPRAFTSHIHPALKLPGFSRAEVRCQNKVGSQRILYSHYVIQNLLWFPCFSSELRERTVRL